MISHRGSAVRAASGRRFAALALIAVGAAGCTDWAGYDLDYLLGRIPVLSTMRSTVSYDPQSFARLPAPNTVPVESPAGEILPPFDQTQLDSVGAVLTNPLEPTAEVLARGEFVYNNLCFSCHGAGGVGNGPVVGPGKFPLGPTLVGGTALTRSDGYIYGVIRVGRGLMPPYADRISHNDRWAVVHYIRQLQRQAGATVPPTTAQ